MSEPIAFNPYEILGIDRGATEPNIKEAYKRLVKLYHPDMQETGDVEKFRDVVKAFGILMSPDMREYFDDTGEVSEILEMQDRKEALNLMSQIFEASLNEAAIHGIPLDGLDMIKSMRGVCLDQQRGLDSSIRESTNLVNEWRRLRTRIKRNGTEENFFVDVLDRRIKNAAKALAAQKNQSRCYARAVVELQTYSSPIDMVHAFMTGMYGASGPSDPTDEQMKRLVQEMRR